MGRSFRALSLTKYHHLTGPWIDGFSYFNFTIKILYIYVCMYIGERERDIDIYIYTKAIYRICVAARVFV